MKMVFGPRRMNAGVQPLKRNLGPSSLRDVTSTSIGLDLPDYERSASTRYSMNSGALTADINLDLSTSAGEQTAGEAREQAGLARCEKTLLVATVPASVLETICRPKLSLN